MRYRYGLTPEQYQFLLSSQDGVCATCGSINKDGRRLAVDHDHETGEIRGLLCHNCNVILGLVNDRPEVLLSLVEYLNR